MMTEFGLGALPDPPPARMRVRNGRGEVHRPLACDLPETAWYDAMCGNPWNAALDLARVPKVDWQRQIAFMLRDVPLPEVAVHVEAALLVMAELTTASAIAHAGDGDKPRSEAAFSAWFKWWQEHFRHWDDPLRTALEPLCRPADAQTVAALLRHFQPAVFVDFLIRCSHAHTIIERIAGQGRAHSELFDFVSDAPLKVMGLEDMTGRLWRRFCRSRGIEDLPMDPVPDFGVNWHAPFVPDPQ